ncbi:MAG: LysR family transcriptional regulator [Oscillospiraceae bacterium]|nr:LysR family transcriptional regulator [Clostridiales bacterium]MDD6937162.1 LysR family transcriptional regulator [Clostridiales bacterium]MDY2961142.1 LysR family transcriptional regulator [Oscillospiraceae bacterium]
MNQYLALLRVLECNSFSDAARVMGYTQSAVSQMIKALEEELGVTLLLRSRTGVTLTREGELLLPYIRDVANAHRMLSEQAANFHGLQSGTIRIGTFTSVSSRLLPPVMKAFKEAHPNLRFELHQGVYSEIEEWVRTGVVDFGFTDASRVTPFVCEPVFRDTMLAVLPEGHPLGENIFVQVGQLKQEPFILLDEGRGGGIVHDMVAAHPEIDVQYHVADDYSILTMVENRLGIAILPELVLKNTNHRVIARQLQPQLRRTLGVIYPKREGLSTAARAFLRELRTALK